MESGHRTIANHAAAARVLQKGPATGPGSGRTGYRVLHTAGNDVYIDK
jgi:hypothetical protein